MIPLQKALSSVVGKKVIMALSGLALVLFVVIHLLGNLSLYSPDGTTFNLYAAKLMSFGVLLTVAEVGLATLFVVHIVVALGLTRMNRSARPIGYKNLKTKGGKSLSNVSSRNMIITGLTLMAFLILHVAQFRFGIGSGGGHSTTIQGVEVHDLHRLVYETFGQPLFVGIYVGAMLFLGFHLRHGFWSAFQSLGAMNARLTRPMYVLGVTLAILLAAGFLFIPIWVYFGVPTFLAERLAAASTIGGVFK